MQRSATTFSSAGPRGLPCIRPKQRVSGSYKSCTFVVCKAGGNGVDPKADADKQREVTKMLLATQKNLLLINNSRVKMQEELAVANRKIQDLGAKSVGTPLALSPRHIHSHEHVPFTQNANWKSCGRNRLQQMKRCGLKRLQQQLANLLAIPMADSSPFGTLNLVQVPRCRSRLRPARLCPAPCCS